MASADICVVCGTMRLLHDTPLAQEACPSPDFDEVVELVEPLSDDDVEFLEILLEKMSETVAMLENTAAGKVISFLRRKVRALMK